MKARKNFETGGGTKIDSDPEYKRLKHNVIVAQEARNKTSVLGGKTGGVMGAMGSGKNVKLNQAKSELKKFVKENKATLKEKAQGTTKRY
tara:strand:+ start:908 stop:1177 length:270 start_codon:yes stop_codon:yes gene_type:complete